jgi:hypothetical protein
VLSVPQFPSLKHLVELSVNLGHVGFQFPLKLFMLSRLRRSESQALTLTKKRQKMGPWLRGLRPSLVESSPTIPAPCSPLRNQPSHSRNRRRGQVIREAPERAAGRGHSLTIVRRTALPTRGYFDGAMPGPLKPDADRPSVDDGSCGYRWITMQVRVRVTPSTTWMRKTTSRPS